MRYLANLAGASSRPRRTGARDHIRRSAQARELGCPRRVGPNRSAFDGESSAI